MSDNSPNGQKIPKGEIRRRNQRMTDNTWPKDNFKGEIRRRNRRMTDNAMVKRYQSGN